MQFAGRFGTWRFTCRVEKRVLQALQFQNMRVGRKLPDWVGITRIPEECFVNG
jgi:hypothetical protein